MEKSIFMAAVIISIVLAVGTVGVVANYSSIIVSKDNAITSLANQKNQIQTWLNGNKTLLASATEQRNKLQNQMKVTVQPQADYAGLRTPGDSKPDKCAGFNRRLLPSAARFNPKYFSILTAITRTIAMQLRNLE